MKFYLSIQSLLAAYPAQTARLLLHWASGVDASRAHALVPTVKNLANDAISQRVGATGFMTEANHIRSILPATNS